MLCYSFFNVFRFLRVEGLGFKGLRYINHFIDCKYSMPIYAYKCDSCGHQKDVLQKMSDPLLTICPSCGAPSFKKQVTAAGFQLKGSGWYVTDFRDKKSSSAGKKDDAVGNSADTTAASTDTTTASPAATPAASPLPISSTTAPTNSSPATAAPPSSPANK